MTTITVPPHLPPEPETEVQAGATAVLTDVRAAATAVQDVVDWARSNGAPEDFSGDAAEAADHAVTRFSRDTDVVLAALERGALAVDTFLDAMQTRRTERTNLMARRRQLNRERRELLAEIEGAAEEDASRLQGRADALQGRVDTYATDLQVWRDRVTADEDRCIRALAAVDEVDEATDVAASGTRVDSSQLRAELAALGTDTDAIFRWWTNLSPAQRNALMISHPDLVGNTNGIPTGERDEANRASVDRDLEYLLGLRASGHELSPQQQRWLDNARSIQKPTEAASLDPYAYLDVEALVVAYQPHVFDGDGIAAVAYGDPDVADHTAVYVPGIMQDGTTIDENGLQALNLYEETVLGMQGKKPPQEGLVSTIAWIGYDSPDWNPDGSMAGYPRDALNSLNTLTEDNAEAGGHALSAFVDGLNSTHAKEDQPHLTVIGHSYGSTTAAHAAADGMDADSLILIGSPGAGGGVDHADGLNMPDDQVFVGSAANDPVTWLGGEIPITINLGPGPGIHLGNLGLGEDPSQGDFGARNFTVNDGKDFQGLDGLVETGFLDNHVNYFNDGNPALSNMADIVSGNADDATYRPGRTEEAHDHLYDWVGDEVKRPLTQAWDDYGQPVVDGAEHVVDTTVDAAGHAVDTVVDTTTGIVDSTTDFVDGVADTFDDFWSDRWP